MEKQSLTPPQERSVADADGEEEEEEEEEEMKMEAFFALVRNFKEMRDRRKKELMIGCDGEAAAEKKRKKNPSTTWIPRFEREDFDEDFQVRGPAMVLPKPCSLVKEEAAAAPSKKKKAKTEEDFLDLNLAL